MTSLLALFSCDRNIRGDEITNVNSISLRGTVLLDNVTSRCSGALLALDRADRVADAAISSGVSFTADYCKALLAYLTGFSIRVCRLDPRLQALVLRRAHVGSEFVGRGWAQR